MALVTLADAKDFMGIPATDTTHDTRIQAYLDAATEIVVFETGPVASTVITNEVHDGGGPTICLYQPPVLSVQSVTEYRGIVAYTLTSQPPGSTVDFYGYSLDDPLSGVIVRRDNAGQPMSFWAGPRSVVVSYTAGQATPSPSILLAIKEDLAGMYEQRQLTGRPGVGGDTGEGDAWGGGPMHLFPRLAAMLQATSRAPSIG